MNWKKYWNDHASKQGGDLIAQVQRKDAKSTELTINHIIRNLNISKIDEVLDVCCGNGILTEAIAKKCHGIVGVDQSEALLNVAKLKSKQKNSQYILGSALELHSVLEGKSFDKIYLQFSLQYFTKKRGGARLIKQLLTVLKPGGVIFIGDITNKDKLFHFYDTPIKKARFLKQQLQRKNNMGKFWKRSELELICTKLGVNGTYLEQPSELPYAHYRFDFIITK
ncbi:hypothetical protein KH5_22920 [Urechidicola sp. KH5]